MCASVVMHVKQGVWWFLKYAVFLLPGGLNFKF